MTQALQAFIRPIAHRGLHDAAKGRVENTFSAFSAAIAKGYGIELDLQRDRDNTPMVFHDSQLQRLVDAEGPVAAYSAKELKAMRYRASSDEIPTLAELLEVVAGKVPLMIEVKSTWQRQPGEFERRIADQVKAYKGPVSLISFHPNVLEALAALAPDVPRGIVSGRFAGKGWWAGDLGAIERFRLRHLLASRAARPSFVSYDIKALPALAPTLARRVCGLPLFTWTVRTPEDRARAERYADAMVFEGFEP
ncbi:MAG: glycerophosphodiester phosphodiesterase family protein [Hyphomicrobiaceae bacterium]